MSFTDRLSAVAAETEALLDTLLSPPSGLAPGEENLWQAMRYGTLNGGKRLRAFLAVEGAMMVGAPRGGAIRSAAAVECLHAYSLIHDDLPSMDDDDLRRGQPTVHIAFDEATAILAGDALQTFAFEILADPDTHADGNVRADLVLALSKASGVLGMVGGQCIDIAAETATSPFDLPTISTLQAKKTGALIRFAAETGAILARDPQARGSLAEFAQHLGLAFQIQDDVLDLEGDESAMGKRVGKDADAGKATFVSLLGLGGARTRLAEEVEAAKAALSGYGSDAKWLQDAADFVSVRKN